MKTKKQERFLKKFKLTKIVERPQEEKRFSIPVCLQKGVI